MKTKIVFMLISFSFLFLGCETYKIQGTYIGNKGAFLEKITFTSNDKVELTFLGSTTEASYIIEDSKVKINSAGEIQILTITDNNCLDGGKFIGKYCKE